MTPLWWWNPQAWAPQTLTQPGWSFGNTITVTERNSSAPDTEREIVSEHTLPANKALDKLLSLRETIENIKSRSGAARLARLEADLEWLKTESPQEYRRIASKLAGDK